jgi:hypothetical protein
MFRAAIPGVLLTLMYIIVITLLESRTSWKDAMVAKGDRNDAIKNAIIDFTHARRFYRKDTVFDFLIKDINDDVLAITILGERNKVAVITENEVDYSYKAFPTRYVERDGKMFYWHDSTVNTPPELITKLSKMTRIDTAIIGKYLPQTWNVDYERNVTYYFCKSDLKRYKRVYTRNPRAWFEAPEIICR